MNLKSVLLVSALSFAGVAAANTALFDLSTGDFAQDWTNTGLITANDNWSNVPSITGYIGDVDASNPAITNADPGTYLAASLGNVDVIANQTSPNTQTAGGVAEFQIANPTVALQGSATADFPGLVIFMNAAGRQSVTFSFDARDIDGSTDNTVQQLSVQYRVGGVGAFTEFTNGSFGDVSTGPSLATAVTPFSGTLAAFDGAAILEFRVLTANAPGSDEWIGIDNIRVTSVVQAVPEPSAFAALGLGALALLRRRRKA